MCPRTTKDAGIGRMFLRRMETEEAGSKTMLGMVLSKLQV